MLFQLGVDIFYSSGQWGESGSLPAFFDGPLLWFLAARFLASFGPDSCSIAHHKGEQGFALMGVCASASARLFLWTPNSLESALLKPPDIFCSGLFFVLCFLSLSSPTHIPLG